MKKVGIFTGSKIAPNVDKLLLNIGEMLSSSFHLDTIGSAEISSTLKEYYQHRRYVGEMDVEGSKRIKQAFYNCLKYCQKEDPDILIQITKYPIYALPVSLVGYLRSVPTIVRVSGDHFNDYKIRRDDIEELIRILIMNNILGGLPLKLADKVIVISKELKDKTIKKGCDPNKIALIPQPIDTERFSSVSTIEKETLRKELDLPSDKIIVLYVGRLTKTKGLPLLEKTISRYDRKDLLFCLIGEGVYGPKLEKKYPSKVKYIGYVEHDKINRYYRVSDLLVHPSPLEGVPNTLLEAMTVGIPVMARDAEYSRELCVPTFNNSKELLKMLNDDWKTTPLPERFRRNNLKEKYIEVINKTIEGGKP